MTKNSMVKNDEWPGLPWRVEHHLDLVAKMIAGFEAAVEAIEAIGEASGSDGLSWAADKITQDVVELQQRFNELRDTVYEAIPAAKQEAERIASQIAAVIGKVPAEATVA